MTFVLDASATGSWFFPDEEDALSYQAQDYISENSAIVPALWWYEVRNLLMIGVRRKRLNMDLVHQSLSDLEVYGVTFDLNGNNRAVLGFANDYKLSVYDAAYLELAKRKNLPLATLDKNLASAAKSENLLWGGL